MINPPDGKRTNHLCSLPVAPRLRGLPPLRPSSISAPPTAIRPGPPAGPRQQRRHGVGRVAVQKPADQCPRVPPSCRNAGMRPGDTSSAGLWTARLRHRRRHGAWGETRASRGESRLSGPRAQMPPNDQVPQSQSPSGHWSVVTHWPLRASSDAAALAQCRTAAGPPPRHDRGINN